MSEKSKHLDIGFTAEMFEDLNSALTGISKRTLTTASFQYENHIYMKVSCYSGSTVTITLDSVTNSTSCGK